MKTKENQKFKQNPPEYDGCPDMSSMIYLEEENVMHNLEIRFKKQTVYTAISKIIVSINPYEWLSLYTDEKIKEYDQNFSNAVPSEIEPHCYAMSAIAYNNMKSESKSQSLIVCGESGSGKTEASKALMSFLAKTKVSSNSNNNICDAVLAINPILEAFGNAKTVMNNNSSRFGKFTKMLFTMFKKNKKEESGILIGSVISSYLLEKSRVIMQSKGERNFHIFFQIFAGHTNKEDLKLTEPKDYLYLCQTENHPKYYEIPSVDEKQSFINLKKALTQINVSNEIINHLFEIVAAILHLGNIKFSVDSDKCEITKETEIFVDNSAILLKLDKEALLKRLTTKTFKIMQEIVTSPLSEDEAIANRNSIAKSIYEETFQWLIQRCNEALHNKEIGEELMFIGILDVFGFENFERNSFEQFCINFANERLQQLFSSSLMISEQKEYLNEGILWEPLKIPNNKTIMKLIHSKDNGIFSLLEDICNTPKGNVTIFIANIFKTHSTNKKLSKVKSTKKLYESLHEGEVFNGFLIKHYADKVIYNCNEFISKNADRASPETAILLGNSHSNILKEIFVSEQSESTKKPKKKKNIGAMFSESLNELIKTLKKTSNSFVRCVNPNKNKSSTEFDHKHVQKQLRCGGLVQALKVMKLGYPTRISYDDLNKRYKSKISSHSLLDNKKGKDYWSAILAGFSVDKSQYQFGLTKVFFKPDVTFIQRFDKFDGKLTDEMVNLIRKHVVETKVKSLKGIVIAYLRLKFMVDDIEIGKILTVPIVIKWAFGETLVKVRMMLEEERLEKERLEAERLEKERLEKERLEAERLEKERLEAERLEKERLEAEKLEKERLENERLEKEKLEAERLEKEKLEAERLDNERLDAEKLEKERLENEKLKAERLKAESLEKDKQETPKSEKEIRNKKSSKPELPANKPQSPPQPETQQTSPKDIPSPTPEKSLIHPPVAQLSKPQKQELKIELDEYEKKRKTEIDKFVEQKEKEINERMKILKEHEEQSKLRIEEYHKNMMDKLDSMQTMTISTHEQTRSFLDKRESEINKQKEDLEIKLTRSENELKEKSEMLLVKDEELSKSINLRNEEVEEKMKSREKKLKKIKDSLDKEKDKLKVNRKKMRKERKEINLELTRMIPESSNLSNEINSKLVSVRSDLEEIIINDFEMLIGNNKIKIDEVMNRLDDSFMSLKSRIKNITNLINSHKTKLDKNDLSSISKLENSINISSELINNLNIKDTNNLNNNINKLENLVNKNYEKTYKLCLRYC